MMAQNKKERRLAILKDSGDWLRVYTPYSRNFVDYLKLSIAPQDRQPIFHESEGKQRFDCWKIRRTYLDDIVKLLNDFWPGTEIVSDLDEGTDWLDRLFEVVPDSKLDLVYRALAQALHPDVGGDEELMKRLNLVYEIKKNPAQFWE